MKELLLLLCFVSLGISEDIQVRLVNQWPNGFKMKFSHVMTQDVKGGWKMTLKFSKPVARLQIPNAEEVSSSQGKKVFCLRNRPYNADINAGQKLEMDFIGEKAKANEAAPSATLEFHPGRDANCDLIPPPTIHPPGATPPVQETSKAKLFHEWPNGFKMKISILMQQKVEGGWTMTLRFPKPVRRLQTPGALKKGVSNDREVYILENRQYNAFIAKCSRLEMVIIGRKAMNSEAPKEADIEFRRKENWEAGGDEGGCVSTTTQPPTTTAPPTTTVSPTTTEQPTTKKPPTTTKPPNTTKPPTTTEKPTTTEPRTTTEQPTTTQPPTTAQPPTTTVPPTTTQKQTTTVPPTTTEKPTTTESPTTNAPPPYDYDSVLHDSILFYEAQRSGQLPLSNRVPWRKDSALNDRGDNGEDLTGGWYDAGDHVKFGFPMAFSVTMLSWGLVEYRDAYEDAGELNYMLDCIKWPLDYFIKAHTKQQEFYGQVGDGNADHAYWGRPEDMTMARPAYKITPQKPGSELAAETAAAMAAASIAFRSTNIGYSTKLLQHAAELYEFADKYRGVYSDSIPNAASFYRSFSGYKDELVWAAAWLYRATQDAKYLTNAEQYYTSFGMNGKPWTFSWDDKKAGVQLLLAEITKKASYKQAVDTFITSWLPNHEVHYTPKGLAWRDKWGPNRYAANTAFLALVAADQGIKPTAFREFARKQIHYMLGDSGRSFVVGFGNNPPERPHHRSSSCPLSPAPCTWDNLNSPAPNPQTLYGALVGGPGKNDEYVDNRKDYIKNEVATDYNAGFQSTVAGLKHLVLTGE